MRGIQMNWEKIKPGFWGAIGGAIVLAIVGFAWGGWVTGGTAQIMAAEAVVDRLTLICVAQFNQDSQRDQKLEELKDKDFWERDCYVKKQGWATILGETKPDSKVADACTNQILKMSGEG